MKEWESMQLKICNAALKSCETHVPAKLPVNFDLCWQNMCSDNCNHLKTWDTGYPIDLLRYIGSKSVEVPKNFVSSLLL